MDGWMISKVGCGEEDFSKRVKLYEVVDNNKRITEMDNDLTFLLHNKNKTTIQLDFDP